MDLRLCPLPVPAADASRAQMPATQISRQNACRQLATCLRRAPELRLRWDEVGERVKLEQILGARCRYGIDRGLRVMQGGPTGQSVSDCGVRGREE